MSESPAIADVPSWKKKPPTSLTDAFAVKMPLFHILRDSKLESDYRRADASL